MTQNEAIIAFNNAIDLFIVVFGLVGIVFCLAEINGNRERKQNK